MINAFQRLYKGRIALEKIQTEEEIRKVIQSELKDEFTHPRARQSVEKKYKLAISRIQISTLSLEEKLRLEDVYKEEYLKLSTGYEV
ncbi:hypothetical protein ACFVR1_03725 [Psychrobacillus sp. NPDC058041]|uniref:hypothetical protein n=1 Tax=Psychrobacillus sp. NPDC058041 TaxID=3346310 RepID=UPI0036DBD0FC